jgi:hypothetical protein
MNTTLPGGISVQRFRFLNHSYDAATGEASLAYSFDEGAAFFERIRFPFQPWPSDPSRQAAFDRALGLLHLVAGVSYYKACVPRSMDAGDHRIDEQLAFFLNRLYVLGLGEFAYHNHLDLQAHVNFPVNRTGTTETLSLDLPERALVAMGGGKDSLVALEMLRAGGMKVQPVCVGESELIAATVRTAGLPLVQIERTLSPALTQMNEAGALNGHVPVTAINSAILLCASILYGYRWIVFSNESSADEATLEDAQGRPVNHQYSKSLDFEQGFRAQLGREISPDIEYFSLLRPFKELAIAERFSHLRRYHRVFSSCNRHFHRDGPRISGRWCGSCPKCRFTALALAPFVDSAELVSMMGADLLDQAEQEDGYRALCRLGVEKPFECVGSIDECRAAMLRLSMMDGWKDKAIVRKLSPELSPLEIPDFEQLMQARGKHCIPSRVLKNVVV